MSALKFFLASLLLLVLHTQCSEQEPDGGMNNVIDPKGQSSFDVIQEVIFDKNCVSCHQEGTTFARQSNLVLSRGKAYQQLIDRPPHNTVARGDGLLLVGTKGLQSIYNSFLWEKINFPDYAHFYDDHPEYGELMPLGGRSLTNGELRFFNEWIIEGAPDTGQVADISLLDDTDRFEIPSGEFQRLDMPSRGVQLNLGPFDIEPNQERELHYFQPLDNTSELFVNRVTITMREGSHHFILYDYPDGNKPIANQYRDIYTENGNFNLATVASILDQRFVFGTQWRNTDYFYPPGVALKLPSDAGFDLNAHYVNKTDEIKVGEVSVNLHTIPKSEVAYVAENLFESYQDFRLPPNQVTTIERQSLFNDRMHVFQLTSHAHRHMTEFEIYIVGGERDGELIYVTQDWEHPPLLTFDPPIILEKGEGFRAKATYNNDTNKTLRFGLLSEDEMMIIFGAFYTD